MSAKETSVTPTERVSAETLLGAFISAHNHGPMEKWDTLRAELLSRLSEVEELRKQVAGIAEAVARFPTITGLQQGCVKDHSLIRLAIIDAQDAYSDTLKRHLRDANDWKGRAEAAESKLAAAEAEIQTHQVGQSYELGYQRGSDAATQALSKRLREMEGALREGIAELKKWMHPMWPWFAKAESALEHKGENR